MFLQGHYYHVFNRGCNRSPIFFRDENYRYLLRKIKESHQAYGVAVIAYCLMPNHYHFLLRQETERPLSDWLRQLFNGYVQAINKERQRTGTLFESRPKHCWIDDDAYLIHVVRYIHANPVAARMVNAPEAWPYSNYPEWIGLRQGTLIDRAFARNLFSTPEHYRQFMEQYAIQQAMAQKLETYLLRE